MRTEPRDGPDARLAVKQGTVGVMGQTHSIELSEDEVVVLNALLGRLADRPDLEDLVDDQAQRQGVCTISWRCWSGSTPFCSREG